MANREYEDYLKFIDSALEEAKAIPRYFSRFSNRIYCNHQKLVMYVLMQKLKETYRGVVSWLRSNSDACIRLGLTRIPVHTTVLRFAKKINRFMHLFLGIRQARIAAIDATGFELESKSFYYRNIDKKLFDGYIRRTRQYAKLSIVIDTNKQLIMSYAIRRKLRHDNMDFKKLLQDLDADYVVADKGYDSKANRYFVLNKLNAVPHIPYRKCSGVMKFRDGSRLRFDDKIYHQRSKVETVFSVIKGNTALYLDVEAMQPNKLN